MFQTKHAGLLFFKSKIDSFRVNSVQFQKNYAIAQEWISFLPNTLFNQFGKTMAPMKM